VSIAAACPTQQKPAVRGRSLAALVGGLAIALLSAASALAGSCPAEQQTALAPVDPQLCASLDADIRNPGGFQLDVYEKKLDTFLGHYCHRDPARGWARDKTVRDTGPFTATLVDGNWVGSEHGTHAPVVIWYSPEMLAWLEQYRSGTADPALVPPPVPAGAVMIKEMYPAPAADCAGVDPMKLFPTSGAAVMIRAPEVSFDGWFWGWYGFGAKSGWAPDWPAPAGNSIPDMGFAQYCMNCHASAKDNLTFASTANIEGHPGRPTVFLSQNFFVDDPANPAPPAQHQAAAQADFGAPRLLVPFSTPDADIVKDLMVYAAGLPPAANVQPMPSQTYDNTWVAAGGPTAADTFLTSSQCIGCHDAGSTGLQFDMTRPNPHGNTLSNLSPYATWRSSPMGLAGRDPFFFAQLASETQTFHPDSADTVQTVCLGCHGIAGERQFNIDTKSAGGQCSTFERSALDTLPWEGPGHMAKYAMLARDGVSCTACHRMALGDRVTDTLLAAPQNACVAERQALLNPDNSGFAKTFTGSFLVGSPDSLIGPFDKPQTTPMKQAMGITPEEHPTIAASEVCGSCHTVHLPVLQDGKIIAHIYEQTTYPEWAFSDFRTGSTPDGALPQGAGGTPLSCQDCHMATSDANGVPYTSKIASIQEYSNFPEAENATAPEKIDLTARENFALHTLVGLNVFLVKLAQQFPDILGIPIADPMLGSKGTDPLLWTEGAMLDQARQHTADIAVGSVAVSDTTLSATVKVTNKVGHKFPSGVGFRRAFIEFSVLDAGGAVLWRSGGTNAAGALVDANAAPLDGEYWWDANCQARIAPEQRLHQPHFETITSQAQAQIYQELVSTPGGATPVCGAGSAPSGQLTTSFLSICSTVKDNRLLPGGYLPLEQRVEIANALGAGDDLALEAGSVGVGDDPDYVQGGSDSLAYAVPLSELKGKPASVSATLYYQATPPFYLQDRFCTARGSDADRLYHMVTRLNLEETPAEGWKLAIAATSQVPVP
jgi:hypothetical protein